MSVCKFCAQQVYWRDGVPHSPQGSDHREHCPGFLRQYRDRVRDDNHEQRVREFLRKKGAR